MPLFEYDCEACGHRFDFLVVRAEDRENAACPECGSADVKKRFSVFASGKPESKAPA